jgi:ribosomal protein S12 methylthiotransferase
VKKRIGVVSLGCAKNLVDSEVLMHQLRKNHHHVYVEPASLDRVDTILINTCGFIGDAKKESIETILNYADAKKKGLIAELFVMGCLSQRYMDELRREIPEVDGFFGVNDIRNVVTAIGGRFREKLLGQRFQATPPHYAYLKIAEGCDRTCSFCAIPLIRGVHRSKPLEHLVEEARWLASQGTKELIVISQDTTYYGLDLYGSRKLASLLEQLSGISGIEWIRLHYTYPHQFPVDVMDVIRDHPKVCKYLDIPLQHISDPVLRAMNRGHNETSTRKLMDTIRKTIPGVAIRTTFLVGFPGETEQDFEKLLAFIEESQFDRAGVFTYSHEEQTPAYLQPDDIPLKTKQKRASRLMELQESISYRKNLEKIGSVARVLIDRQEGDYFVGRTEADSPEVDQEVWVNGMAGGLLPGRFCMVSITGVSSFELYAEAKS